MPKTANTTFLMMTDSIAVPLLHCLRNPKHQRANQSPRETHAPTSDVAYHELSQTQVPRIATLLPKLVAFRRRRKRNKIILPASLGN